LPALAAALGLDAAEPAVTQEPLEPLNLNPR
jgi:hypothetical protein